MSCWCFIAFHSSHTCWLKVQSWQSGQKSSFVLYSWPWELCEQYTWSRLQVFFPSGEKYISFFSVFVSVSIRLSEMTKKTSKHEIKSFKYLFPFLKLKHHGVTDALAYKSYSLDVREHACLLRPQQKITLSPKWDSNLHWVIRLGKQVVLPPTPPLSCPSQDVVCRLWCSTSCASTPNTSCPWAPALINRKISLRGGLALQELMWIPVTGIQLQWKFNA